VHVNERANEINHQASKGGNVQSRSANGDTDGSDEGLPDTCSPRLAHRGKKSRTGTTNHSTMPWSVVRSTRPNSL
jgi:hypothetical protein